MIGLIIITICFLSYLFYPYLFRIGYVLFHSRLFLKERLVIFVRWPVPGKTKTRMTSKLTKEEAAELQVHLTEHLMREIRKLRILKPSIVIEGYYTDGTPNQFSEWLGSDLKYERQPSGHLGIRLKNALPRYWLPPYCGENVVIIGSDIPDISSRILIETFNLLHSDQQRDVVCGPTEDGGYYLIGMKRPYYTLFDDITWSTDQVFKQTEDQARKIGVKIRKLITLQDVDYPDDLPIWEASRNRSINSSESEKKISVIIPVLNESSHILGTIKQLSKAYNIEIIVVDGGSTDNTVDLINQQISKNSNIKLLRSVPGRATQQNYGFKNSTGEIVMFVHGDTRVPLAWDIVVREYMKDKSIVVGSFQFYIESHKTKMLGKRIVEWGTNLRATYLQLPYGDQTLFMKREIFEKLHRFPNVKLMEDYIFVKKAQKLGKIQIASVEVRTSGRRFQKKGLFKTVLLNQFFILCYKLGVSTDTLSSWYYKK